MIFISIEYNIFPQAILEISISIWFKFSVIEMTNIKARNASIPRVLELRHLVKWNFHSFFATESLKSSESWIMSDHIELDNSICPQDEWHKWPRYVCESKFHQSLACRKLAEEYNTWRLRLRGRLHFKITLKLYWHASILCLRSHWHT